MNKVILIGRLIKEPELTHTTNDKAVCKFTLAVNREFSKEREVDFINIVTWNKTAEFANKWFKKGKQVAICGKLQIRNYEKDGVKKYVTEVIADSVYFTDSISKNDDDSLPL